MARAGEGRGSPIAGAFASEINLRPESWVRGISVPRHPAHLGADGVEAPCFGFCSGRETISHCLAGRLFSSFQQPGGRGAQQPHPHSLFQPDSGSPVLGRGVLQTLNEGIVSGSYWII